MKKGGFSWKRLTGVTKVKQKISRKTGVPLTKSGRQRKIGGMIYKGKGCLVTILLIIGILSIITIAMKNAYSENTDVDSGNWAIQQWTSQMDSSKSVQASLYADKDIEDWLHKKHKPELIIRCLENKTEIFVITDVSANPELGLYNQYTVRLRFDNNKPISQRWSGSTDNTALFAPQSTKLAKQINKSEKMLFEFTPFQMSPQVVEFDVKGLEPYLKKIAETCKWKLN